MSALFRARSLVAAARVAPVVAGVAMFSLWAAAAVAASADVAAGDVATRPAPTPVPTGSGTADALSGGAPPARAPSADAPSADAPSADANGTLTSACDDASTAAGTAADADTSMTGKLKAALAAGDLLLALVLVFIGGFLTALSPCVYPLIPITLSILGTRGAASHVQGFLKAGTYVSGMVILYASLGTGFAAFGLLAGSALQSPVITLGVALLCTVMAASMFGAFELALPSALQTRLSQAGGSGFRGAFVMGLVAGVIAAPCTGPVLSFILTIIARDGDVVKGAGLMTVYALGMGMPFLVLGTFSQAIARMPKSGRWMEIVKGIFGILMLGAALYYVRIGAPFVAAALAHLQDLPWLAPLLVVAGLALGALHLSFKGSPLVQRLRKGVGIGAILLGMGTALAWLNAEPVQVASTAPQKPIAWNVVKGEPTAAERFDAAVARAAQLCRPVMIDFFAEWCVACKELDHRTYVDPAVRSEAQRFVNIKVDATNESPALTTLQERYGIVGLPTVVLLDGKGKKREDLVVTGFVEAPAFTELLKKVR